MTTRSKEKVKVTEPKPPLWVSLMAGGGAGLICSVLCAPLDVAKTRMQVQGSLGIHKYTGGVISTILLIYKEEGIRGAFRGVGPALITVPLFWGVYWPLYDNLKPIIAEQAPSISPPITHLLAAISAGCVADIITNPFWVIRTRFQTLALHPEDQLQGSISMLQMTRKIYAEEGWISFYRGLSASLLGLSHVAIQFPLYEYLKKRARSYHEGPETLMDLLFASITAKIIAAGITYPHEVLRARMQDTRGRDGSIVRHRLLSTFLHIVRKEGISSLWSGLRVNLARIIPATTSTFISYEYLSRTLSNIS